jgi:hypothetical protein
MVVDRLGPAVTSPSTGTAARRLHRQGASGYGLRLLVELGRGLASY